METALASAPKVVSLLKMENIPKKSSERDIDAFVHNELKSVRGVDMDKFVPQLTKLALEASSGGIIPVGVNGVRIHSRRT